MTIDRLQINNFQAHGELKVQLDPRVTVIVGQNDTGKSSVLRALRWLATNRPLGDSFLREGTDQTEVKVRVDGKTIRRRKGKINQYDFAGHAYKAFGSTVPDQILAHLNLGEVNLQGQHDPPYLLSLSPGEAAKALNEIVDLRLIDVINRALAKETKTAKIEVDLLTAQVEASRQELEAFGHVEQLRSDHEHLCQLQQRQTATESKAATLGDLLAEREQHAQHRTRCLQHVADAQQVLDLGTQLQTLWRRLNELEELIADHDRQQLLVMVAEDLGRMGKMADRLDKLRTKRTLLTVLLNDRVGFEEEHEESLAVAASLQKELGDTCPLCGNRLPSSVPMST